MDHQSPATRVAKDLPRQYAEESVIHPPQSQACSVVEVVHLRGSLANLSDEGSAGVARHL